MKGKVLSAVIVSGIILTTGVVNGWGGEDQFRILENTNAIESLQELKIEKIKGYDVIGNFQDDGFIIVKEQFTNIAKGSVKEILLKDIKNHKEESIDVSSLNLKRICHIKESNGWLYFNAYTASKSQEKTTEAVYEVNLKNKKIRDISSYIDENENIYQCDHEKGFILVNNKEGRIRSLDRNFKEIQNFQIPIKEGQNDIFYLNNIKSIKEEGGHITKVYFLREKMKEEGYLGLDEILSQQAYVYDVDLGVERMLPFKETILSLEERRGQIFIEDKRDNNDYLTQKDEMGKTLNEVFLYSKEKGYLRRDVNISPDGRYAVMHFIRTFEKDINEKDIERIEELYLIDIKSRKKTKLIAVEEGEGGIFDTIWSENGRKLAINLSNMARESEYCIVNIEDVL